MLRDLLRLSVFLPSLQSRLIPAHSSRFRLYRTSLSDSVRTTRRMEAAFFVGLAIELLIAGLQAADGAGIPLFAGSSKKQIPIT